MPTWTSGVPTHELTRAHAFLRTRRQIFSNKPNWALSRAGLRQLTGRAGETQRAEGRGGGGGPGYGGAG